jgi:hypothetical protein
MAGIEIMTPDTAGEMDWNRTAGRIEQLLQLSTSPG